MTGRDYRDFLTTHRSGAKETGRPDEADKLLVRMKEGLGSTRYNKVDYDQLKSMALERKISGNRSLLKMNKLKNFTKASKESTLLKQHRTVWQRELGKLDGIRHRLEREQERLILQGTTEGSSITMFMLEAEDYKMQLGEELEKFRKATAEPVWSLKDDLKIWLSCNKVKLQHGGDDDLDAQHAEICEVIESVKSQQEAVMKQLEHEQWALESELDSGFLQGLNLGTEKCVMEGIPLEAEILECPDLEIRDAVLQEFLTLDEKYRERLRDLDKKHSRTLADSYGGWSRDDHVLFESIVEMYPRDMQNRRTLYIDRLRKQFPQRSRAQLVEHEDWMITHRYHTRLRNTLVNCWAKDKQELYEKAAAIFADVSLAAELESIAAINKHRQEVINEQLREKIELWREQKLEAMRIEAELEAQRLKNVEKEMELEKQKEEKKRASEKEKVDVCMVEKDSRARREEEIKERERERIGVQIQVYKEHLQKEQEKEEAQKRERLAELRKAMEVQAEHDKERVAYRQHLQELKEEHMREEKIRLEEEDLERERRLEALREQVAVHVESDPIRMIQGTKASKAHLGIGIEQDVNIQKPLFEMNTFSSDTVMADPRLKLEQALRKAGLHENPYARHMISTTKPLKAPRPDMKSSLFKDK